MVFRYEKLPTFCYICSCFDHNEKDCEREIDFKINNVSVQKKFGPSLRVDGFSSMYLTGNSSWFGYGIGEVS